LGSWLLYGRTIYYSTQVGMIPVASWNVLLIMAAEQIILRASKADITIIKKQFIVRYAIE